MFMTYKIGFFFFVYSSNMAVYGPVLVRNGPKEAEKGRASSIQRKGIFDYWSVYSGILLCCLFIFV